MAETINLYNLYDAKTHLSSLVDRAAAGEEIIIAKAGKPLARLVPLEKSRPIRRPGIWKGRVWMADDFNDPLPPDILAGFYGEPVPEEGVPNDPPAPEPVRRRGSRKRKAGA